MIRTFNTYSLIGNLTVEQTIATVRALLNEQDNQRIQDLSLRMFINSAKQEIHEKLIASSSPIYDYIFHATAESISYMSTDVTLANVDYSGMNTTTATSQLNNRFRMLEIDLAQHTKARLTPPHGVSLIGANPSSPHFGVFTGFFGQAVIQPINYLYSIKNISLLGHGTGKQVEYSQLMDISHLDTAVWHHTFVWAMVGAKILIVPGRKLMDVRGSTDYDNFFKDAIYELHAVRKPLLDDLLLPQNSVTYGESIDLPNTQYTALMMSVQRACLESLQKVVLAQIDQAVDASIQNKTQTILTNQQLGKS